MLAYSIFILIYTLAIILWGAWVRISGSGAGCGDNWPLCHGEIIPVNASLQTWIEFSHRISTAVFGIFLLVGLVLTFKRFPKEHPARFWILAVLFFTATEALIGAKLVLFELVDRSLSPWRLLLMPLHLLNTFALLFVEFFWIATIRQPLISIKNIPKGERRISFLILFLIAFIAASGALAALAVHIFPSFSLFSGIQADFAKNAPFLVEVRILHPLLAFTAGIAIFILLKKLEKLNSELMAEISLLRKAFVITFIFGALTLLFLSPIWMKLTHLLLADLLWLTACLPLVKVYRE
jgi:cytochrome c oxidase assembly protein subunit 15